MNSLRSRLILGSSLIAVVPLTIAILLLSQRMGSTVRTEATARLDAALVALQAQLADVGRVSEERIRILARDPQLRRLYLVRPAGGAELAEFLAERRFLLGLDLLRIVDTSTSEGITVERLTGDSTLAMVARARVHYAGRPVGVLEGAILLDAAYVARLSETSGIELGLSDPDGRPGATRASFLTRTVPLAIGPPPHPLVSGSVSTAASDRTIAALQWTAALLGALGLVLAIALALAWSAQVSRPVERLAAFSDRIARGEWDQPLALDSVRELEGLVASLERMRADLQGQRDRLAVSERQAAWGQMARKVAHEVRNPLTPIAVSIADLKRSHDLGRPEFPRILDQAVRTIGEEVETLKRLLQEFAEFGRLPAPVLAPCRVSDLFADLETLYAREIGAGRLAVTRPERGIEISADAGQIRQALVNLVKNGLEALHGDGRVTLKAKVADRAVEIAVADTGPGLTEAQRANLFVPGFTTKTGGSGLGLTIVERIVNDHHGTIAVDSAEGRGTTVRLRFEPEPLDGPARAPLGRLAGSIPASPRT